MKTISKSLFKSLCISSIALATSIFSVQANAFVLSAGESISFDFDFTSFADMSGLAKGLTIIQRYSAEDILSGTDSIFLEIMATPDGTTLTSTTITESTFGPTAAWGFNTPGSIVAMEPVFTSYTGSFRITALQGSVSLSEVTTSLRDSAQNDWTITNLSAVPEPSPAWAMLAGLGALAGTLRIRSRRA